MNNRRRNEKTAGPLGRAEIMTSGATVTNQNKRANPSVSGARPPVTSRDGALRSGSVVAQPSSRTQPAKKQVTNGRKPVAASTSSRSGAADQSCQGSVGNAELGITRDSGGEQVNCVVFETDLAAMREEIAAKAPIMGTCPDVVAHGNPVGKSRDELADIVQHLKEDDLLDDFFKFVANGTIAF